MTGSAAVAVILFALLGVARGTSDASDEQVQQAIAELQTMVEEQTSHIERLKGGADGDGRRLTGSLYGDIPGTTVYTSTESIHLALDHMWMLICGMLVMFMQAGFAMLEGGCARFKNVQNILLKNLTDVCVGTIGWWLFGWAWAFSGPYKNGDSEKENSVIGFKSFAGHDFVIGRGDGQMEPTMDPVNWYFQWAFASAAATIVSGGVAERVNFAGYSIFSFLMTAWIYPFVVGATWGKGFLMHMNRTGFHDFAGSGIVHLTGGVGALVGAAIAGPRVGRWDGLSAKQRVMTTPEAFDPHSLPLVALGTFILWFGWYGFNCGSTLAMHDATTGMLAGQVAMNTTIAATTGGLCVFIIRCAMLKKFDVGGMCNGILAGLVSITAGCANMECGFAALTAFMGAVFYQVASSSLKAAKIDDVVDAFAVHGACGAWGVLAAAFFDWGHTSKYVHAGGGFSCLKDPQTGKCWGDDNHLNKDLIAAAFAEVGFIIGWSGSMCAIIFIVLKAAKLLVASNDLQEQGFDLTYHSPSKAYDIKDLPRSSI